MFYNLKAIDNREHNFVSPLSSTSLNPLFLFLSLYAAILLGNNFVIFSSAFVLSAVLL